MREILPTAGRLLLAVLVTVACANGVFAQDQPDQEELVKQYDRLPQQRFYRHGSTIFDNVTRFAQMDESRITPIDRFMRAFFESRWDEVQATLEKLPDNLSSATYNKMLDDLAGRYRPLLTLDDFTGLADACPGELTSERIRKLGLLLRVAVLPEQRLWLKRVLEKGTTRLGGQSEKRLATGRILLNANFDELARAYLPSAGQASKLEDLEARDEILKFLASQEELEEYQQTRIAQLWQDQAMVLSDPQATSTSTQQAITRLVELLGQAEAVSIEPWIGKLVGDDLQASLLLSSALGKRWQGKTYDTNVALRTNALKAQKFLLLAAAERTDLAGNSWRQVATASADWWISEAEFTFEFRPSYRLTERPKAHVAPGDLLESAPEDAWAETLPGSLRERIDVCLSKAVLVSDRFEDAVELIIDIAKRNPGAGTTLAEEYLKAWAHRNDPHVPEAIRKQYRLPADARIVVTPMMMERNIENLARMMDLFRSHGINPQSSELLVDTFDVCYSNAEVYRQSHIEKVFGPIEAMDEDVFFAMVRTMTDGLSERWRKMESQEASGTRRTEQETLAMVREGYGTAIEMIDSRVQKHPGTWRILVLAGSAMSDWADFEYYQQLVAESITKRTEVFRRKNNQSKEYFTRAAETYAGQVPDLDRRKYSIDVYLAWFHSLLGINTGGKLNLAKPLDRRTLEQVREMIRGLPGPAAKEHVNKFAGYVQARMEDAEKPLHEELKYKYLAGSLVITKESPFSFTASEKVAYYDELLDELRLETRVDGPNTISRDHQFGIIFSVQHSEAMGRMADFGQYLTNELPPSVQSRQQQSVVTTYDTLDVQGRRDELEMNIREALGLFFDVEAVVFSPRDVKPRAVDRPGWEETILAYVHAKAKDSSVDKIPRIQMNLEFLDLTGPVTIAAESAETMIKVTDKPQPPRPFHRVDLTEIVDSRDMAESEEVLLEVKATASGLVPELDELLDLDELGRQLPIARIDPHEGTLVSQINSWGDTVHAVSERRWTIALDASSLVAEPRRIELRLPEVKVSEANVTRQAYVDMDLIDLEGPATSIGEGPGNIAAAVMPDNVQPWVLCASAAGAVILLVILLLLVYRLIGGWRERPLRARDVFRMPAEIDGFVVVQLLRSLAASELVRLSNARRAEMQEDVDRIQNTCFGNGSSLSDEELRLLAKKWLKITC